jgi:hypothetical protein
MSKSSKHTETNGAKKTSKSVGKPSSSNRDGSSFNGQSNASGANLGATHKSGSGVGPNIVIDIESENLTYNQARSIRLQLQRDVE